MQYQLGADGRRRQIVVPQAVADDVRLKVAAAEGGAPALLAHERDGHARADQAHRLAREGRRRHAEAAGDDDANLQQ